MPVQYQKLADYTLTSNVYNVTFSSISQDYRDLVLVYTGSGTATGSNEHKIRFNNDSGGNYGFLGSFSQQGSNTLSGFSGSANTGAPMGGQAADITQYVYIFDYSATDKHKAVITRGVTYTGGYNEVYNPVTHWRDSSAVTSLTFASDGSPYGYYLRTGTRISLYGVSA